jgi:hypothetical protein
VQLRLLTGGASPGTRHPDPCDRELISEGVARSLHTEFDRGTLRALAQVRVPSQARSLGEPHLRLAISDLVEHYHLERDHQGLENRLITSVTAPANENVDPAAPMCDATVSAVY